MSRSDRAKQFAPFDALKGLQNALRIKEFEHDRVQRGDVQEEKANEISKVLMDLEKRDRVWARYFQDGHYFEVEGVCKLVFEEGYIEVGNKKIQLNDLFDIKKVG